MLRFYSSLGAICIRVEYYASIEGAIQCEQDQRTLEMVKRPSVSETTSFIWATESTRSFTACVYSSRRPLSTLVMRAMCFSAHSLCGRWMVCSNAHASFDQHPFCYSPQLMKVEGSSPSHLDHRGLPKEKKIENKMRNSHPKAEHAPWRHKQTG